MMSTSNKTLIIACGALARELSEVVSTNNLNHLEVECLPASYHNSPEKIPAALEERILKHSNNYDQIFVGYADCGTGGKVDKVCEKFGLKRLSGSHCYEFFAGRDNFANIQENNIGIPKPPKKPVLAGSTASILSIPGPDTNLISNKPITIIPAIK